VDIVSASWASDDDAGLSPAEGREARRVAERRVRREKLLESAIDAIRTIGPGATMEQLAKSAGVTKPILYRHFGDRDGLITALAGRYSLGVLDSVQEPLQSLTKPRDLMAATIDGYVRYVEQDPYLYGFLRQQSAPRKGDSSPISSLVDVIAKQVAVSAGEQLAQRGSDSGAAVPWAYGIVGLVHQATDWWLEDATMSRERFVAYLTDLLWNGLAGGERGPAGAAEQS
jgi:AcrR family transcriptional regulator